MSGLEVAHVMLKGTATAVNILRMIIHHVREDKRAAKLVRRAKQKFASITSTISEYANVINECEQLRPIMYKCINDMSCVSGELRKLCNKISMRTAPIRVAEATPTAEQLDRIVFQLEILETRIENCCTAAVSISSQKLECENIKTLIKSKQKSNVSASDVLVVEAPNASFNHGLSQLMEVMWTEQVFSPTLRLLLENSETAQMLEDLGSISIAGFLRRAGCNLCFENFAPENQYGKGVWFLQLASDLESSFARYWMGYKNYEKNDYRSAVEHLLFAFRMERQSSSDFLLAELYLNGYCGLEQRHMAIGYLEQGMLKGDKYCSEMLALCKLTGFGTEKNGEEALRMAKATESNETTRLVDGVCHFYGIGTRKSENKAQAAFSESFKLVDDDQLKIRLMRKGLIFKCVLHFAKLNVMSACEFLSDVLMHVAARNPKYDKHYRKWTRKAADLGCLRLQNQYAYCCEKGWYGETSKLDAFWYYRLAAIQGDADAQLKVARLYLHGVGVCRDLNKTMFYLNSAYLSGSNHISEEVLKLRTLINEEKLNTTRPATPLVVFKTV